MPARIVGREDNAARAPGADLAGGGGEELSEEGLGEAGREVPDGLASGRLHEGDDVEPPVAVVAERDRPPADWRPDPAADRLQPEPMPVLGPDLDGAARMRRL